MGIKKYNLKIGDRIGLTNVLPEEDTFERLVLRESILKKVSITVDELAKYQIKTDAESGSINWNNAKASFEYEFSKSEIDYIRDLLKSLGDSGKLRSMMLDLYREFVT